MKDPRLATNADWWSGQKQLRERAEAAFLQMGDPAALLPRLVEALADPDRTIDDLPGPLADDVGRLYSWTDGITDCSWFGISTALAMRACAAPSATAILSAAARFQRAPWWVSTLFDELCAAQIRGQPTSAGWRAVLGAPPPLPQRPQRPAGPVVVYQQVPEWTIEDPFEVLDEEGAAIQLVVAHAPLRVLRLLDPAAWFRAVDAWDDARLVCAALWGDEPLHDRAAILDLLKVAAPVFAPDGSWNRRTAAIVLAYKVLEHARALAQALRLQHIQNQGRVEAAAALSALMDDELPAFFAEAWDVLLNRSDGLAIAAALHARLSAPPTRNTAWQEYEIEPTAAQCLARALTKRGTPVGKLRELWVSRRDMPRQSRNRARRDHRSALCAISGAVEIAAQRSDQIPDLFNWFAETLSPLDTDWTWFATAGALDALLGKFAVTFAADAGMLGHCEDLYARLEPQRRLSEFGPQYTENSTHESSVIALGVVLQLIDRARVAGVADVVPAAERAYARAARLSLVSSPAWDSPISTRLALVYAIVIRATVSHSSLRDSLRFVLSDPGLAATTVVALIHVLGRDVVEPALNKEGLTLEALEVLVQQWSAATGLPDDDKACAALRQVTQAGR